MEGGGYMDFDNYEVPEMHFDNRWHKLEEGEDLDVIVRKYNVVIEHVLEANDWKKFEDHKVGDMIKIPMTIK